MIARISRAPLAPGLWHLTVTLVSTSAALALALALAPIFNDAPAPLLLVAALVSAWVGGLWPGLLATALTTLALGRFFDLSRGSVLPRAQDTAFDLALFMIVAGLITWMTSHLRQTNRRLEVARSVADSAVRAREDFLAAAAHDLKSPLAVISMTAQVAQRSLERPGPCPPRTAAMTAQFADIEASAWRMAAVLDELLDMAHLQAGRRLPLNLTEIRLLTLVEAAVARHQRSSERHVLRIVSCADPVGTWDAARLARMLDNLISNAIKYSPGGGEVTLEIAQSRHEDGRAVAALCVRDQGVGVPAADEDRVFERFYRAGNVGPIAGTGIGLWVAREIVEQHGGTLTLEHHSGAGSTFVLRLPI